MMKFFLVYVFAARLAFPAFAADTDMQRMDLFPKGRASYIQKSEDAKVRYQTEAQNFVNDLYENKGEGTASFSNPSQPKIPEAQLDAFLNSTMKNDSSDDKRSPVINAPPIPSKTK